jgi:hypothetical protein
MTTITVNTPAHSTTAPRGAQWAARAFSYVADWLTYASARNDARQTQNLRAVEARRVRTYAQSVVNHDPRYAADLMAAADRHEAGV